ncbi:MAG: TlpA family protein disulfide reductase, partial [Actinomycetota bacterium]
GRVLRSRGGGSGLPAPDPGWRYGTAVRLPGQTGVDLFTATWCPYCGAEAPYLEQEIWQRYRNRDLQVICIDVKENAGIMGPFVARYAWTFPVLLDDDGEVSMRFAPVKEGLPPEVAIINAHFFLDGDGVVRYRDFLNMERFDAKASHVREFLEGFLRVES